MSNIESFRQTVSADPRLAEKWKKVSATLIRQASDKCVQIDAEQLMSLSAVRLHVLTGDDSFLESWQDDAAQQLESWRQHAREVELITAISDREHAKHEAAQAHLDSMTPEEKMRHARSNNLGQKAAPAVERPATPEAEAAAIKECNRYSGGARIAAARRFGLL